MAHVWHFILHILGIDTQQSEFYDFWSGIATQASLLFAGIAVYRRHNCHKHLCPFIGRYKVGPYFVCRRHHPDMPHRITLEHIQYAHTKHLKEVNT